MSKFYKVLIIFFFMWGIVFSIDQNTIQISTNSKTATLKLGVTKLNTEKLDLNFDAQKKIVTAEIESINNSHIYISDKSTNIPALLINKNGKNLIFKKNMLQIPKKYSYEVTKNPKKNTDLLKINVDVFPKDLYIFIIEKNTYKIVKVYKGNIEQNFEQYSTRMKGTFKFLEEKAPYFKLGTYEIINGNIYVGETGEIANFAVLEGDYPTKYIYNGSGINTGVVIRTSRDKWRRDYNKKTGIFDSWSSGKKEDIKIRTSKNEQGAVIRIFTNEKTSHVSWQLIKWDGGSINEEIVLEYVKNKGTAFQDEIHTDRFTISLPSIDSVVMPIEIKNPIVMFDVDNYNLGRVLINSSGFKTLNSEGNEYTKNGEWITGKGIDYPWDVLKRHKIVIKSNTSKSEQMSMSNGGTFETYIGMGQNGVLATYEGNDESLSFGITKYDFNKHEYDLVIIHYNPNNPNFISNNFLYKVRFPKFDGRAYCDNNKDINPTMDFVKKYEIFSEENIYLGTVGFKDLDIRITKQSGGKGVKIRATEDIYLKNLTYKDYPLVPAKLYIQNGDIIGENEKSKESKVYLKILDQEKLVGGGKFELVKKDGKGALEVGVEVNNDKETYFRAVTNLFLEMDRRYVETTINFNNSTIPLIIEQDKGWIYLNKTNYPNGMLTGYPNEEFGNISGEVVDIPKNSTLEILNESFKVIDTINDNSKIVDIPIGSKSKVTINYFRNNGIKFGVKSGNYISGDKGSFYIRVKDSKNKYLFLQKYNINLETDIKNDSTQIYLKNPLVLANDKLGDTQGMIIFNNTNGSSSPNKKENNFWTDEDSLQWWKINNARDYPQNTHHSRYTYDILDSNGNKLNTISPESNGTKHVILNLKNGLKLKFGVVTSLNSRTALTLGLIDGYNGNYIRDTLYVVLKDPSNNTIRCDKLFIQIDEFDPRYYGKVYPVDNDNLNGQVGTGKEKLGVYNNNLIDLGTDFRYFMRYLSIVDLINKNKDIYVYSPEFVTVKKIGDSRSELIKGKLKFQDKATGQIYDYINIIENKIKKYSIKLYLSKDEYEKLNANSEYEIYNEYNDKETLLIGLSKTNTENKFLKKLPMNKPLNFKVLPDTFEISTSGLNFGKINKYSNNKQIYGEAEIKVKVNNISSFTLEPSTENINIYKKLNSDKLSTEEYLQVKNLKIMDIQNEKGPNDITTKYYKLSGILDINSNKDISIGQYENTIEVTATVIF